MFGQPYPTPPYPNRSSRSETFLIIVVMSNRRRSSIGVLQHEVAEQNKDSIKVLCRFRPPNKLSENAKRNKNDSADAYSINTETGEIVHNSAYGDSKIFKFDQVTTFTIIVCSLLLPN